MQMYGSALNSLQYPPDAGSILLFPSPSCTYIFLLPMPSSIVLTVLSSHRRLRDCQSLVPSSPWGRFGLPFPWFWVCFIISDPWGPLPRGNTYLQRAWKEQRRSTRRRHISNIYKLGHFFLVLRVDWPDKCIAPGRFKMEARVLATKATVVEYFSCEIDLTFFRYESITSKAQAERVSIGSARARSWTPQEAVDNREHPMCVATTVEVLTLYIVMLVIVCKDICACELGYLR